MTQYDYDLMVIGAGSGGVRAARIAAGHGAKVGVVEEYLVGGTCVIRGCVPKKLLVYGSHYHEEIEDAAAFGWRIDGMQFDWSTLRNNVQAEVLRLNGLYTQTLQNAGVDIMLGRATFVDAHSVQIGNRVVRAAHILISTGARPSQPDYPGAEYGITSNEVFHLPDLPATMLVAGGGYIASEFAGVFHGLGSEVIQLYRGDMLLRGWDDELRERLTASYRAKGIDVRTKITIAHVERKDKRLRATLSDGTVVEVDQILHAIGRVPNVAGLGLEQAGVALDADGAIAVSPASQTNIPHIYAVGDVTDRLQLTPIAIKEGHAFADTVFGNRPWVADHSTVASAVFSQPALASVGLSEQAARAAGHDVRIYRSDYRPMKYTLPGRSERSFAKLVVDGTTDRVLGAHMLGPEAPEIIQALAIAIKFGVTKAQFDATVAVHPTAAEEFVLMR